MYLSIIPTLHHSISHQSISSSMHSSHHLLYSCIISSYLSIYSSLYFFIMYFFIYLSLPDFPYPIYLFIHAFLYPSILHIPAFFHSSLFISPSLSMSIHLSFQPSIFDPFMSGHTFTPPSHHSSIPQLPISIPLSHIIPSLHLFLLSCSIFVFSLLGWQFIVRQQRTQLLYLLSLWLCSFSLSLCICHLALSNLPCDSSSSARPVSQRWCHSALTFYFVTTCDVLISLPCCCCCCVCVYKQWFLSYSDTHSHYFIGNRPSLSQQLTFSVHIQLSCRVSPPWNPETHTHGDMHTYTHTHTHTHTHTDRHLWQASVLLLSGVAGCKCEVKALWHTGCGRSRGGKSEAILKGPQLLQCSVEKNTYTVYDLFAVTRMIIHLLLVVVVSRVVEVIETYVP